jgi:hypothetical protein
MKEGILKMKYEYEEIKESMLPNKIFSQNVKKDDLLKSLENGIDIELKINGKEVNFLDTIKGYDKIIIDHASKIDEKVTEKAIELLEEKFEDLIEIQQSIQTKTEELKDEVSWRLEKLLNK